MGGFRGPLLVLSAKCIYSRFLFIPLDPTSHELSDAFSVTSSVVPTSSPTSLLLVNPSYELPVLNSNFGYQCPNGWNGPYCLMIKSGSTQWGGTIAASGSQYLGLQGTSSYMNQSVTLLGNSLYLLSFYASTRLNYFPAALSVTLDGALLCSIDSPTQSTIMQYYSVSFQTSTEATQKSVLAFQNTGGTGDRTVFLDAIKLVFTKSLVTLAPLIRGQSFEPISVPTAIPTSVPTFIPTAAPTLKPTLVPTTTPSSVPTAVPISVPTSLPTSVPSLVPRLSPLSVPTFVPTSVLTSVPTAVPTSVPTAIPMSAPTSAPTSVPTSVPTAVPTSVPTSVPTAIPMSAPTSAPTSVPTSVPTAVPTSVPTAVPTAIPMSAPTSAPTLVHTSVPTAVPTSIPTAVPTAIPMSAPTSAPTSVPTAVPTSIPTAVPTAIPMSALTSAPTSVPTSVPTAIPMSAPTSAPMSVPTAAPTLKPTLVPTTTPSSVPTKAPTDYTTLVISHPSPFSVPKAAIVVPVVFSVTLVFIILYWRKCRRVPHPPNLVLKGNNHNNEPTPSPTDTSSAIRTSRATAGVCSDNNYSIALSSARLRIVTKEIPYSDLVKWTGNFSDSNFLGSGKFGDVYHFISPDDTIGEAAVKRFRFSVINAESRINYSLLSMQTEINVLSAFNHPNIIRLLGRCTQESQTTGNFCLVYELGAKGSLHKVINHHGMCSEMTWNIRIRIALGTASALNYLHCHGKVPVVHRDIKSANIVLMDDFTPKLIGFGSAKYISPSGNDIDYDSTVGMSMGRSQGVRIGTAEYMCNYYRDTGEFTIKSEVYSMGIVLLELIHGITQGSHYYEEKIIFGETGNNLPIDIRAGSCPCEEQLTQLAIALIAPYNARIDSMINVLRPLRQLAKCFSMNNLTDLQNQNNWYLRENRLLMQYKSEYEEMIRVIQRCTICYDYFKIVELIACTSAGHHYICKICLEIEITRQRNAPEFFWQHGRQIVCLQCYVPYTSEQLATASSL